jgi:hypothetical protein
MIRPSSSTTIPSAGGYQPAGGSGQNRSPGGRIQSRPATRSVRIHTGRGFIQQEHGRILDKHSPEGHPLGLAARAPPPLADACPAQGQRSVKSAHRLPRRYGDLIVAGIRATHAQVFTNGP